MQNDTFFTIGSSHKICQDYADSKPGVVVVSDGCSSAKHSDIGARILTRTCLNHPNIYEDILAEAEAARIVLDLNRDVLCATLLTIVDTGGTLEVSMVGDGVAVSRKRGTGELDIYNLEFVSGAPWYLVYNIDRKEKYLKEFGDAILENGEPANFFDKYPDGVVRKSYSKEEYDLVAVFSDGIHTFSADLPTQAIIKEFMAFKNYGGNFVERRCQRALKDLHLSHYDDFSMGAMKA